MKTAQNSKIANITKQYLDGRYTQETETKAQQWLINIENADAKEEASLAYWNTLPTTSDSSTHTALKRVFAKAGITERKSILSLPRRIMRIAAAIIPALIILGSAYYFSQREQSIEVFTAYGETKHLILPDSSQVWLNSGSSIRYLTKFTKESRIVNLKGEAYFSVKKDSLKPFTVQTNNLSVNVLGTEFNVKAYTNDNKTTTTLDKGKIEVVTTHNQSKILTPNEQLVYNNKTSQISVQTVESNDVSRWKSGQLIFTNATISEILQTLERRFNVSFESENIKHSKQEYTIKFLKDDSLESILNILKEVIADFSYQKENNNIKIISNNAPMK
jgi:ferric-dicitrate binding protein FerR (iron transport regulator)